ncbi:MAG: hypothetical protein KTR14_07580 [Vampirovibrio sp.]|nr:hypothetical protein [Vampirovibrio sp.]
MASFFSLIKAYGSESAFLLLLAVVYSFHLSTGLFWDEAEVYTVLPALEMAVSESGGWFQIPTLGGEKLLGISPLSILSGWLGLKAAGLSYFAARLPAIIVALAGLVVTYAFSMDLMSRRTGAAFFSAAILATMWGYFTQGHLLIPETFEGVLLTVMVWMMMRWHRYSARAKVFQREINVVSGVIGGVFALLFLTTGAMGVLKVLTVTSLFIAFSGHWGRLSAFRWKLAAAVFLWIGFPWLLFVGVKTGESAYLLHYIQQTLPGALMGKGLVSITLDSAFRALIVDSLPWTFLVIPMAYHLFMEGQRRRTFWQNYTQEVALLLAWIVMVTVFAVLDSSHTQEPVLSFYAMLPALALLTGLYVSEILESSWLPLMFKAGLDGTILMWVGGSLLITVFIFQVLPDDYGALDWTLAGQAELREIWLIKPIMLDNPFPIWKLWLLPVPFVMFIGAGFLFWVSAREQYQHLPGTLVFVSTTMLVLVILVVIPVFERSLDSRLEGFFNRHLVTKSLFTMAPDTSWGYDAAKAYFYATRRGFQQGQPQPEIVAPSQLGDMLSVYPSAIGVSMENSYYQTSKEVRAHLRIADNVWSWHFSAWDIVRAVFRREYWQYPRFRRHLILFESLMVDEPVSVALPEPSET